MADTREVRIEGLNDFQRYILDTNLVDLFNSRTISFNYKDIHYDMWLDVEDAEGIIKIYIQEVNYGSIN